MRNTKPEHLHKLSRSERLILFLISVTLVGSVMLISCALQKTLPKSFGKTHFILGQTAQQRAALRSHTPAVTPLPESISPTILFTPDDHVRDHLIDLIVHEQERISIAVFVFTDKHIAHALLDAHQRGVFIEIVTDSTGLRDRHSKIRTLCHAHIPIYIYDITHGKKGLSSVMHHKFALFKRNKNGQPYVWVGSCNFTRSACESNQEYALILADTPYIERFTHQFETLKQRSYRHEK